MSAHIEDVKCHIQLYFTNELMNIHTLVGHLYKRLSAFTSPCKSKILFENKMNLNVIKFLHYLAERDSSTQFSVQDKIFAVLDINSGVAVLGEMERTVMHQRLCTNETFSNSI